MLKNYLKIAWRNLVKGKLYSIINITGLAVGIACCLLIGLYVYEELRFDRFHEKADRIYRLNVTSEANDGWTTAWTPHPLVDFLREGFAEIEQVTSVIEVPNGVVRNGKELFEEEFHATDPAFFDLFDFEMIRGNASTVLEAPAGVVLTESTARRIFGSTAPIGKTIEVRLDGTYYQATVGGIVKDPPQYSSIQFRVLISWNLWTKADPSILDYGWNTFRGNRFASVHPQTNTETLELAINNQLNEQVDESWGDSRSVSMQPLTEVHMSEYVSNGLEPTANASFIYIAVIIGGLILIIACINFTSLSIGHSVRRAREVGMRKAMGARRGQLIAQFWGETILVTIVALLGGLLLTEFLLPYFGTLVSRDLELNLLQNPVLAVMVLGIVLLAGLLAGSYPALYLSGFHPSRVFRSKIHASGNHGLIRVLTGVQFTLAVTLIIGTFFMNRQMGLLMNTNPGYEEEYVLQMDVPAEEGRNIMEGLQARLNDEPSVRMVSGGWHGLAGIGATFQELPISADGQDSEAFAFAVEPGMPELLDLQLVEGRFFSDNREAASNELLINETMAEMLGWDDPLGRTVSMRFNTQDTRIIGVVEDFHFQSMHREIGPLIIHSGPYVLSIYTRINGNNIQRALSSMEQAWQDVAPSIPFGYTFLDDQIEQQYRSDRRWASTVELGSIIAIVISCMGLFGLATLASAKRAKEIGIRKVLGATVASVTATLSKDFLKPVAAGLVIAIPISYLLVNRWLADFAYRIELGVGPFILAAVITLAIALLTVSGQSIRSALANPVDSLRNE